MINWNIKHKIIKKDGKFFYLCNQAVMPYFMKARHNWKGVTCKNCLKQKNDTICKE